MNIEHLQVENDHDLQVYAVSGALDKSVYPWSLIEVYTGCWYNIQTLKILSNVDCKAMQACLGLH